MIRPAEEADSSDSPGPVSLETNRRIDAACQKFEADWRAAHQTARESAEELRENAVAWPRPQLQSYLAGVAEPERSSLLAELLMLELDLRSTLAAEQPTEADYSETLAADVPAVAAIFRHWRDEFNQQLLHGEMPRPTRLQLRPTVEGYEIIGELGRGGMGVVYEALDLRLKRRVALKMLLAGQHAGPDQPARLRAEAEIVARLRHPNIVQIFDIDEQDGYPYLTFELIDGVTLAEFVRREPQPPALAAELVEAIARAVDYAHQKGIVHRDLKPTNVLLEGATGERSGPPATIVGLTPKITDFGLAKILDAESEVTLTGTVLGTAQYMSPEQAEGRVRDVGPASDIYSLGAILYVLITGQPPFQGTTPFETLQMVVSSEPVRPTQLQPRLPKDIETICLKCLRKNPSQRYETAGALADDLRRFLSHEPIQARTSGRIEKTWRWCRRRPLLSLSTSSVALLTACVAVSSYFVFSTAKKGLEPARPTATALQSEQDARGDAPALNKVGTTRGATETPSNVGPVAFPTGDAPPPAIAPFDATQAKQHQQAWADYLKLPVEYTNSIGMKFVLIPPGEFLMGVEPSEIDLDKLQLEIGDRLISFQRAMNAATPRHSVRITQPYYLQTHEVSFPLFQKVLGWLPEEFTTEDVGGTALHHISLADAVAFCDALSNVEGKSLAHQTVDGKLTRVLNADGYRLPTEAEWAFACRAGTTTTWFFGDDPHGAGDEYASVLKEYQTRWQGANVKANPFGLFNMYAGSNEWCFDGYRRFNSEPVVDPFSDPDGDIAVGRGGSEFAGSGSALDQINSFYRERRRISTGREPFQGFGRVLLPIRVPTSSPVAVEESPHAIRS